MISADDIVAAAGRIRDHVRRTPTVRVTEVSVPPTEAELFVKLECMQVTGSFKARGATNKLKALDASVLANGIVAASGGNHGLATARAARLAGVPAIIYLPANASPSKIEKLRAWGAEVRVVGNVWDEAHAAAIADAERRGAAYFHPFADEAVIAGNGTVALELLEDVGPADLYVIAIGGGGLISGMSTLIRARNPKARIVGVEPIGSPTLFKSLKAGSVVTLPEVVATMACARTDEMILDIARANVDDVVLVEDEALEAAARWLWFELGVAADLSGAASIAALLTGAVRATPGERVCGLVCGAGPEGIAVAS